MTKNYFVSLAKGAGIAAGGAALAFLAEVAIPAVQSEGSGIVLTIAALASVVVNAARKAWFTE